MLCIRFLDDKNCDIDLTVSHFAVFQKCLVFSVYLEDSIEINTLKNKGRLT